MDDGRGQEEYIRQVLEAYRETPGTMGTVRRADRMSLLPSATDLLFPSAQAMAAKCLII